MEILAVFNAKGGVGKTTSAVNLAACFAAMGERVVVFDLDAQGNATSSMGIMKAPGVGTYDVITGRAAITDALVPTFMENLSLVGATKNLATIDVDLALGDKSGGILSKVVAPIKNDVDILIMDCAPTFGSMTINALISADAVFIPSQPSPYAHDGLVRTWTILSRIRQELHPALRVVGILPTLCSSADADGGIMSAMKAEFGNLVDDRGVSLDSELFAAATAAGVPACVFSPAATASLAYVDLAARLLASASDGDPLDSGKPGAARSRFRRLDNAPAPDPEKRQAVIHTLEAWRKKADQNGILDANINVPPVDAAAMEMAAAEIVSETGEEGERQWSAIARWSVLVGAAILLATSSFVLGWAAGAEKF